MTKNPSNASAWRNTEIEHDASGYISVQEGEREDRTEAERDELIRAPGR